MIIIVLLQYMKHDELKDRGLPYSATELRRVVILSVIELVKNPTHVPLGVNSLGGLNATCIQRLHLGGAFGLKENDHHI